MVSSLLNGWFLLLLPHVLNWTIVITTKMMTTRMMRAVRVIVLLLLAEQSEFVRFPPLTRNGVAMPCLGLCVGLFLSAYLFLVVLFNIS